MGCVMSAQNAGLLASSLPPQSFRRGTGQPRALWSPQSMHTKGHGSCHLSLVATCPTPPCGACRSVSVWVGSATVTKRHTLGSLNHGRSFSPRLEAEESRIKVWAGPLPSEACEGQSTPSLSPGGLRCPLVCGNVPPVFTSLPLFGKFELRTLSYWFGAHSSDSILTWSPAESFFPSKVTLTGTGVRALTSFGGTAARKRGRGGLSALRRIVWLQVPPRLPRDRRSTGCCPRPLGQFCFSRLWRCRSPRCSCLICHQLGAGWSLLFRVTPAPPLSTTGVCPPTGTCGVTPRGCTSAPRPARSPRPCSGPG